VLDDLENGILRGNSPAASTIGMLLKLPWLSKGPFKAGDPRAQHVSYNMPYSTLVCSCFTCCLWPVAGNTLQGQPFCASSAVPETQPASFCTAITSLPQPQIVHN
jgi:hypothetical protein